MMAYYQAVNYGDQYSYIFPVSGSLSYDQLGDGESSPGAQVHAYHGKSDSVVSFSGGKRAVKILNEEGVTVDLTEFKGGHHGIFNEMKLQITKVIEEKIDSLR
jgi:predicted esterase